jgi:hypothetical protein
MLHSRIKPLPGPHPATDNDNPVDLLASFLPHLFPDEVASCLGDPGQTVVYASPRHGGLQIMVPTYPVTRTDGGGEGDVEAGRRLFAHYLWGGAMVVADGIESAAQEKEQQYDKVRDEGGMERRMWWRVKGERVLELGAGECIFFFFFTCLIITLWPQICHAP